jgi:mobilome CxxCx(11)CxxC protein
MMRVSKSQQSRELVPLNNHGDSEIDKLRSDCWDSALYAFGTASIFERRARRLGYGLKILTYVGFVVPLAVGTAVLSFNISHALVVNIAMIAGALLLVQLVLSAWSIVAGWDQARSYAIESMTDNFRLAGAYKFLAEHSPADLKHRFEVLAGQTASRDASDYRQDLTEKEKRAGLRAALFQYRRQCVQCGAIPVSREAITECGVCGK